MQLFGREPAWGQTVTAPMTGVFCNLPSDVFRDVGALDGHFGGGTLFEGVGNAMFCQEGKGARFSEKDTAVLRPQ